MTTHRPNDTRYSLAALAVGLIGGAGVAGGLFLAGVAPPLVGLAGVGVLVLLAASVKYTDQWEKAVLLRLGRYRGLRGPGYFAIVPILDRVAYIIDQRIRTAEFGAESCLTRDTVPVNVDAIAFWVVRDAERAALEVQDYDEAVTLSAQTALRDAIGKHDLAELIQQRGELGQVLKAALEQKMTAWGIHVQSVEIRDVIIPAALEDAMSRQAQAERERQSRIILGESERQIAESFKAAAEIYGSNGVGLHLRAMNMLFEGLKNQGALVIVPSTAVETMSLGGLSGLTALAQSTQPPAGGAATNAA